MRYFAFIFVVLCPALLYAKFSGGTDDIRVMLARDLIKIELEGNIVVRPLEVGNGRGDRIVASRAVIIFTESGFRISGREVKSKNLLVTGDSAIIFNGRSYVGEMRIFGTDSGRIMVVNVLPLEEYLVGLVTSEMPSDWSIEAIKAQAVTARTYAAFQRRIRTAEGSVALYDVEAGVVDQVYAGGVGSDHVREAVESTAGQMLNYRGEVFKSFFHSTCGSQTELPVNVWGEKNLFPMIVDKYCASSPHNAWSYSISKTELAKRLKASSFSAETVDNIQLEHNKNNPRVATVVLDTGNQTVFVQGNDFRKIVGFDNIKSTWFNAALVGEKVEFAGRGYGHGVGMCQWGAKGMADSGKSYREILKFYYPGAKIVH